MTEIHYNLLMSLRGEVFSPELSSEQLTDHDALVQDILSGQFYGEFFALFEIEETGEGKYACRDISEDVREGFEALNEDPTGQTYDAAMRAEHGLTAAQLGIETRRAGE